MIGKRNGILENRGEKIRWGWFYDERIVVVYSVSSKPQ